MIQYITSRKNKIVEQTINLRDNKISNEKKQFVIEGEHLFEMALKANNISYILTTKHINNIPDEYNQYIVTKDILEKISLNKSVPEVIAVCNYVNESIDLSNRIIYLDDIQDPGNLGTILRSALAFSYFDILLSENTVNKYNYKAIQSSQGALFNLNIERANVNKLIDLKSKGYKIIASVLSKDSIKLRDFKKIHNEKIIIIVGNEGQGISKEILDIADYKVFIEMNNIDSLNAGVAASILMYNI
jgi:rRNA methylases